MNNYDKRTPDHDSFYFAIYAGDEQSVKRFLENNIDPNENKIKHLFSNLTPLKFAIHCENINIVRLLVTKGALVDQEDSNGITALKFSSIHYYTVLKNLANAKKIELRNLYATRRARAEEIVRYLYAYSDDEKNKDYAEKTLSLTCEEILWLQEQLLDDQYIQKYIIHSETRAGHVAIPLIDLKPKA